MLLLTEYKLVRNSQVDFKTVFVSDSVLKHVPHFLLCVNFFVQERYETASLYVSMVCY